MKLLSICQVETNTISPCLLQPPGPATKAVPHPVLCGQVMSRVACCEWQITSEVREAPGFVTRTFTHSYI